jgi:hypothetical protein
MTLVFGNTATQRFALKAETQNVAMCYDPESRPFYWDIRVSDCCNANTNSGADNFGYIYTDDTGPDAQTFLTGSRNLQVNENDVFEITG